MVDLKVLKKIRERERQRELVRERQRDSDSDRNRDRDREGERERERGRERERERERERARKPVVDLEVLAGVPVERLQPSRRARVSAIASLIKKFDSFESVER